MDGTDVTKGNLEISGVGSARGGVYDNVSLQGTGKIHGNLDCARADIQGMYRIEGGIQAKSLHMQGKVTVRGPLTGEELRLEGMLTVEGACEAEVFDCEGTLRMNGMLNAERVRIRCAGKSQIGEIAGGSIRVERGHSWHWLNRLTRLTVDAVEGDTIFLESTVAKVVRGNQVTIGRGSRIEVVEYRDHFTTVGDGYVGRSVRVVAQDETDV